MIVSICLLVRVLVCGLLVAGGLWRLLLVVCCRLYWLLFMWLVISVCLFCLFTSFLYFIIWCWRVFWVLLLGVGWRWLRFLIIVLCYNYCLYLWWLFVYLFSFVIWIEFVVLCNFVFWNLLCFIDDLLNLLIATVIRLVAGLILLRRVEVVLVLLDLWMNYCLFYKVCLASCLFRGLCGCLGFVIVGLCCVLS